MMEIITEIIKISPQFGILIAVVYFLIQFLKTYKSEKRKDIALKTFIENKNIEEITTGEISIRRNKIAKNKITEISDGT